MLELSHYPEIAGVTPHFLRDPDFTAIRAGKEYRYIGLRYPNFTQALGPEAHYQICKHDLFSFVSRFKELFPNLEPQVDLYVPDRRDNGAVWDESVTDPLFREERSRLRRLAGEAFSLTGIPTLFQALNLELLRRQQLFNQNLSNGLGITGEFNPRDERLLMYDVPDLGDVTLSVYRRRYAMRRLEGYMISTVEPERMLLRGEQLPILVEVPANTGDQLFNQIKDLETGSLEQVFPC